MDKHTTWTAYVASIGAAIAGSVTLEQAALWIGIITSLGTFGLNWYFKRRKDKREVAEFEAWKRRNGDK